MAAAVAAVAAAVARKINVAIMCLAIIVRSRPRVLSRDKFSPIQFIASLANGPAIGKYLIVAREISLIIISSSWTNKKNRIRCYTVCSSRVTVAREKLWSFLRLVVRKNIRYHDVIDT